MIKISVTKTRINVAEIQFRFLYNFNRLKISVETCSLMCTKYQLNNQSCVDGSILLITEFQHNRVQNIKIEKQYLIFHSHSFL
jgi:hypothetical protein